MTFLEDIRFQNWLTRVNKIGEVKYRLDLEEVFDLEYLYNIYNKSIRPQEAVELLVREYI